jgi:2,3-bisphosphoglycerate-independent phosphoglycerate mutase
MKKPLVLCILDGVGIAGNCAHNAVAAASMPYFDELRAAYPHTELEASGPAVGLPENTMGNSEVGHITIGAGRTVNQFLRRFETADWNANKPLADFMAAVAGNVHIVGLMSDGRVHSDIAEIITIARYVMGAGKKVILHFIADGRDVPPQSAQGYIDMLRAALPDAEFATLIGRYYAMDRNNNLDRTELAFDAIAHGRAEFRADTINEALAAAYARGETDEFIKPTIIGVRGWGLVMVFSSATIARTGRGRLCAV